MVKWWLITVVNTNKSYSIFFQKGLQVWNAYGYMKAIVRVSNGKTMKIQYKICTMNKKGRLKLQNSNIYC